jgi:hypothetical protein
MNDDKTGVTSGTFCGEEKYRVAVGLVEGKKTFGRFSRRWQDNIKIDLKE